MKKVLLSIVALLCATGLWANPADPEWQTKTLEDGTTIEVRQIGDEFYHYWETRDGKLALQQPNGKFIRSEQTVPTAAERLAQRAQAKQDWNDQVGTCAAPKGLSSPNLAPKGIVILVNFSDTVMGEDSDQAFFDNLCNATNCTANVYNGKYYPSAAQYFADQSNDAYRPQFDVFGPVDLPHGVKYYGEEGERGGNTISDLYMADFVIDAVLAAADQGCDFSNYDSDDDGYVDFVYFIFAGQGQSAGGGTETIWPHHWYLNAALYYNRTHGRDDYYCNKQECVLPVLNGKVIDNYACSAELGKNDKDGIGTLCHEFSHVLGLSDLYDTDHGWIDKEGLTPGYWNIMDNGNHNADRHCPPNYDVWQKYFFGWIDPVNPGSEGHYFTLHANGTDGYNAIQINESGEKQGPQESGVCYYLENRQQQGWDEFLPSHGLVVWKINYDEYSWSSNKPNASTNGNPTFVIDIAGNDVWTAIESKPVTEVIEQGNTLTFKYIDGGSDTPPTSGSDPDPDPIWSDWAYYDNGDSRGGFGCLYWGVMFPAHSLAHDQLSKIKFYERADKNTQPISIDIYNGGNLPIEMNKVFTDTIQPNNTTGWHEVTLSTPVVFNKRRNLWIILSEPGDQYPAVVSRFENCDPNGRWMSSNGKQWRYLKPADGSEAVFMLRAYVEPSAEGIENISTNDQRQTTKILRDGQLLIIRDGNVYNVLGTRVY